MYLTREDVARVFISGKDSILSYFKNHYQSPSLRLYWKHYLRDGIIVAALVGGVALMFRAGAATYVFTQSSWSGGSTANNPNHTANKTGWTQYAAKDSTTVLLNGGADGIAIGALNGTTSQTSATDFNAGTFSNSRSVGLGSLASVTLAAATANPVWEELTVLATTSLANGSAIVSNQIFTLRGSSKDLYRYDISSNTWTAMAQAPTAGGSGGALLYPGSGDFIYAITGGTQAFSRYSISGNSWTALAVTGIAPTINDLAYPGSGDFIYYLAGTSNALRRYSISGNSWTTLAAASSSFSSGAEIVYPGSGDYFYVTFGNNSTQFLKYSISGNSWSQAASSPGGFGFGSSLVYPGTGDYIYAARGGNTNAMYRYSVSGNTWEEISGLGETGSSASSNFMSPGSGDYIYGFTGTADPILIRYSLSRSALAQGWTSMASLPASVSAGSIVYTGGDYLYGVPGGFPFYRYSISGNSWSAMTSVPNSVGTGGALAYTGGDFIYLTVGGNQTFLRYSISGNSWSALQSAPGIIAAGSLMYPGSGDYLYTYGSTGAFYRYSISGNSWTTLASSPNGSGQGAYLSYPGTGDFIYSTTGNGDRKFQKYSISGNSWTILPGIPGPMSGGGSFVSSGADDNLYLIQANSTNSFYRYSVSTGFWNGMSGTPALFGPGSSFTYANGIYLYGFRGNGTNEFYRFNEKAYLSSGTFTSSVMDTNLGSNTGSNLTNVIYNNATPAGTTISVDVRAGNTSTPDGTWSGWISSVASGANISSLAGNRYVQYGVNMTTSDPRFTSSLDDISFGFTYYASSTTLTSSAFDSQSAANILSKISWQGTTPSGTAVKFQLRSAPDNGGAPGTWSVWMGPDGTSNTYFTASDGSEVLPAALKDGVGDEWFQYKVTMTSTGANTPTVTNVAVTYVVNNPPDFDQSFGVNVSQIATSTDPNIGKLFVQYKVRDSDSTSGSVTPGFITPSFEYDIGGGWTAIPAQNLSTGALTNKAVDESVYTLYEAYIDIAPLLPNTYSASAKIRVKANDNEGANNIAYGTSTSFVLDTKPPVISSMHIDGTSATSTVTFSANDDTAIRGYIMSNNADFSPDGVNPTSGIEQVAGTSTVSVAVPWTLSSGATKTVYVKVIDARGNVSTHNVVVPATPSNMEYRDISNIELNSYREFIAWNLYPEPAPAGAPFGSYQLYRSDDGNNYTEIFTSTNPAINYFIDNPVATSTVYFYKVVFVTANGDKTPFSRVVSDAADGKGGTNNGALPLISGVTTAETKNTSAKITWTTDDLALSEVDFGTSNAYGRVVTTRSYVTDHAVYLTGLTPNTQYFYRVRSIDAFSVSATDSNNGNGYTFTTGGGPVISNVTVPSITDTSAEVSWKTNLPADSYVYFSTSPILESATQMGSSDLVQSPFQHSVVLTGLTTDTLYYYKITSTDGDGNTTVDDNNGAYYTLRTTNDTKAPIISDVIVPVKASNGAVITWKTDELSTSKVEYGTQSGASTTYPFSTEEITTPTIFHSVTLSPETAKQGGGTNTLVKKTQYYYRVKSTDPAGNTTYSAEGDFTTTEDGAVNLVGGGGYAADTSTDKDTTRPTISDVKVIDVGPFSATVTFTTDEDTRAIIQYGTTAEYGSSAGSPTLEKTHKVVIRGVKMGTKYHFAVNAVDKAGNISISADQDFQTTNLAEDLGKLAKLEQGMDSLQEQIENLIESALPSVNPPFIEKPAIEEIGEDFARISWRTNVKAYATVMYAEDGEYGKTGQYGTEQSKTDAKTIDHVVDLSNLKPNTKYHFKVKSYVFIGADSQSDDMTFTTKAGRVQPQVRDRKKDSMRVVWNTPVPTNSIVSYKVRGSQYASREQDDAMTTSHDVLLENLSPKTTYEIRVSGTTPEGNTVEGKDTIIASTNEDVTPPTISSFKVDSALVPGRNDRTQTIVSWKTDEPATSVVYYDEGPGSATGELSQMKDNGQAYTDTHVVILTSLKPGTIYRFQIISVDDANNMSKLPVRTIVTPSQSESIVDVIFKNFDDTFKFMKSVR